MRPLIVSICLVAMLAGCGTSDEKRVRATIAADLRAYERDDWNGVCALRTAAGRREFLQASLHPDANTCSEAWTLPPGGNEPIVTFEFKRPSRRVTGVDVANGVAQVRYDDGSVQRLRKVGGRWLIDAEPSQRAR